MNYINRLREKLIESGYGVRYQNACLNYAQGLINKDLPVIFDKKHLSLLIGIDIQKLSYYIVSSDGFYTEHNLPKSNGGIRKITMPSLHLKEIQRWILDNILYRFSISESAYGFVRDRNIKDNASLHVNQPSVINFDIKDFFPSIKFEQVFLLFHSNGYTKEISYSLAKLCTYNGTLPQGAPSSPCIANILCNILDKRISNLVLNLGYRYSRYADDITISGDGKIKGLIPYIVNIIESENFNVNLNKMRIQENIPYKEITGLMVGETVKVKRKYKKKLEQHIYYCEKYGVYSHLKEIKNEEKSYFKEYLFGMANFVKMIEPNEGQKYLNRLNKISWGY
ncbi:reverse transcriptase family protein [Paenibacillus sp. FSL R5-0517]|uniref:reverse transcriptase family protein n=1 Tax=Paenibacillus sp. FSL R5-0517 TaxID=2921647 RepID=UPI0030DA3ADD